MTNKQRIVNSAPLCRVYCDVSKLDVKKSNDLVINEQLANTLKAISVEGSESFYSGNTLYRMLNDINGGAAAAAAILSFDDFKHYEVGEITPLNIQLTEASGGKVVATVPRFTEGGRVLAAVMVRTRARVCVLCFTLTCACVAVELSTQRKELWFESKFPVAVCW